MLARKWFSIFFFHHKYLKSYMKKVNIWQESFQVFIEILFFYSENLQSHQQQASRFTSSFIECKVIKVFVSFALSLFMNIFLFVAYKFSDFNVIHMLFALIFFFFYRRVLCQPFLCTYIKNCIIREMKWKQRSGQRNQISCFSRTVS
jgi:hypothetical protein